MQFMNDVIFTDCIDGMKSIPNETVDLIIADPPYNLSNNNLSFEEKKWNKVNESWDKLEDYDEFTYSWLFECHRILKDTGSIWVFGTRHNIHSVNLEMNKVGFSVINEVIWYKRNAFPNLTCRRLTESHETIIWASKSKNYRFNYQDVKADEFSDKKKDRQLRDVWDITIYKAEGNFGHPTQKPLTVLSRILKISGMKDGLCVIPFAGVGSECFAAKEYGMNYIGFETNEEYVKIALERLKNNE